jgi:hypothetical protein
MLKILKTIGINADSFFVLVEQSNQKYISVTSQTKLKVSRESL